jgi:general secretion pathway protein C
MRIFRALVAGAVPASILTVAFLDAKAVGALVEGTMSADMPMPVAASKSAAGPALLAGRQPTADAILDRNPFDHLTGSLRPSLPGPDDPPPDLDTDPRTAPLCVGVKPLVLVGAEDQTVAFASLEVDGKRVLRKRGGEVGDKHVAYVGRDRVWLEGSRGLCQALLFGVAPRSGGAGEDAGGAGRSAADPKPAGQTQLEIDVGKQIAKVGPNEYVIERSAVDRILEAQAELMKRARLRREVGERPLDAGDRERRSPRDAQRVRDVEPREDARGLCPPPRRRRQAADPPHTQRQANQCRLHDSLARQVGVAGQFLPVRIASRASSSRSMPTTTRSMGTAVVHKRAQVS